MANTEHRKPNAPTAAPIEPLTLNIPQAAIRAGCTNFFMEELLRHDQIKWVMMGDHKVVYEDDLIRWLDRFKKTELYKRAVAKWQEKNGELPGVILNDEMARLMFEGAKRDEDGTLMANNEED